LIVASKLGHSGVVALLLEQELVAIDHKVPVSCGCCALPWILQFMIFICKGTSMDCFVLCSCRWTYECSQTFGGVWSQQRNFRQGNYFKL